MSKTTFLSCLFGAMVGGGFSWFISRGKQSRHQSSSVLAPGVRASPKARFYAAEHDIDLSRVQGSGPDGRITEEDVRLSLNLSKGVDSQSRKPGEGSA